MALDTPSVLAPSVTETARRLCRAARARKWRGPDIYDALWGNWPGVLTGGRRRRQALIQLHARSPVDLRRLYRREHPLVAKALAVFAQADLRLAAVTGDEEHLASAGQALELLAADRSAGDEAWGYPWDMQTRWSYYPKGSPNVVATVFAALSLSEGARSLSEARHEERARKAAEWVQRELFVDDLGIYAYHPGSRSVIHNASLLGARLAWELLGDDPAARQAASRAVARTLAAQRDDGAFPYGEGGGLGFVDSFHTGYVLEGLSRLSDVDPAVMPALERGAAYYREHFFDAEGRALLWPGRRYPEDAHAAGTGLTSLSELVRLGLAERELLERVAARTVSHVVRGDHAVHRRYRLGATRVNYLRWADSHVALGLANAALALGAAGELATPRTSA
jgi:hypothetical protein